MDLKIALYKKQEFPWVARLLTDDTFISGGSSAEIALKDLIDKVVLNVQQNWVSFISGSWKGKEPSKEFTHWWKGCDPLVLKVAGNDVAGALGNQSASFFELHVRNFRIKTMLPDPTFRVLLFMPGDGMWSALLLDRLSLHKRTTKLRALQDALEEATLPASGPKSPEVEVISNSWLSEWQKNNEAKTIRVIGSTAIQVLAVAEASLSIMNPSSTYLIEVIWGDPKPVTVDGCTFIQLRNILFHLLINQPDMADAPVRKGDLDWWGVKLEKSH